MHADTDTVATHLLNVVTNTPFRIFLGVLKLMNFHSFGMFYVAMSLVGPRPCLYNQYELISDVLSLMFLIFDQELLG